MHDSDDVLVVFDPFVLQDGLSDNTSVEWEALEVLVRFCRNKLVVDDRQGALIDAYIAALGGRALSIRTQLLTRGVPESKLRTVARPHPVSQLEGLPSQHQQFFRRALAVRPRYLVYRIRQWQNDELIRRVRRSYRVSAISPAEYIRRASS